jgi:hypothetical protein
MHRQGEFHQLVPRVQVCRQESSNGISRHPVQKVQLGDERYVLALPLQLLSSD